MLTVDPTRGLWMRASRLLSSCENPDVEAGAEGFAFAISSSRILRVIAPPGSGKLFVEVVHSLALDTGERTSARAGLHEHRAAVRDWPGRPILSACDV